MAKCGLLVSLLVLSSLACLRAERINSISTKTSDCLFCGMVEGVGYLTVKVCGSTDCCLSRSLDSDGSIDWLPGAIDTFQGSNEMLECSDYEIGAPPFTVTAFHDGSDGLTPSRDPMKCSSARTMRLELRHSLSRLS